MKRILAFFMSLICLVGLTACGGGGTNDNPPPSTEVAGMERNYVYMWNQSGVGGADKVVKFQTENYAMTADAKNGALTSIGAYASSVKDIYDRADFTNLIKISSMKYSVGFDGGSMTFNRHDGYQRIIESGRYLQRTDFNSLVNSADKRWTGRMEIAATQNYVAINYEVHNGSGARTDLDLSFTMQFAENLTAQPVANNRGITLRGADGQGLTVLRAKDDETTQIEYADGSLSVLHEQVDVANGAFGGFGIIIIPSGDAKPSDVEVLENIEACTVTAEAIDETCDIPITYDTRRGIYVLNISDVNSGLTQSTVTGRNTYDRVKFSVKNESSQKVDVPISFQKTRNCSLTGISPMIRDAVTLEPTGIQVQISKNWHTNPNSDVSQTSPERYLEGSWYHGNTCISVNACETETYEYTCAYGEWGGVYSASHAQLCLIGWGGANNLLWEESALNYKPELE